MLLSVFLSLITLPLVVVIYKIIWIPFYVQYKMRSQGITGPPYKIIFGSIMESLSMRQQARKDRMELSHDIFPRVQPDFYKWMVLYGKNFLTWNGPQPHMVITEPELVKEILANKEGVFLKLKLKGYPKKLAGDGLIMAEGPKWLKLRKLANQAFHAESLKGMIPAMVASVENMLENWKQYEGKEIDVYREFLDLSSEVISRTAFGSSYSEGKHIFDMLRNLEAIVARNLYKIRPFGIEKIWKSQDDIESDKLEKSLRSSIMELVRKREEKLLTGQADSYGSDFLGSLIRVHHDADEKIRISTDDLVDECKVFYLAGHATTSGLLSWASLLLAIHTDWQEKARKEVVELFGQGNPTEEGLPKLKIMSMIINETSRLYTTSAGSVIRRVTRKVKLGRYEFPANMEFNIASLALHRDQEIWGKDAHLFNPERFAKGIAMATKNSSMSFIPFGFGPRTCVGLSFANNEAKIAMAMILQRYKFTLSSNYVHSPLLPTTLIPEHGVKIMLQPVSM